MPQSVVCGLPTAGGTKSETQAGAAYTALPQTRSKTVKLLLQHPVWRRVFLASRTPYGSAGGQATAHGPHVAPCFLTPSPSTQTFDPPYVLETTFFRGQETRKTHGAKIHQRLVTVQICVAGLHQRLEGRGLNTNQMFVSWVPLVLHPTL